MDARVLAMHNFYEDMILDEIAAKMAASTMTSALASTLAP
jgi:hypothetical protein